MAIRGVGSQDEVGCEGYYTYLSSLVRGTDEDKAVRISANDTVELVSAGENFDGVVRTINEASAVAGVQQDGWAEIGYTGSNPSVGLAYLVGGSTDGKVALADEVAVKQVAITVSTGGATGASAADPDLVGGKVVGVANDTNQDQFIDNIALGGDGAVTVTLAANATGDNKFKVAVQKPESAWPRRYLIRNVDTTNKTVTVKLD